MRGLENIVSIPLNNYFPIMTKLKKETNREKIEPSELEFLFRNKQFHPVYFFYGDEDFLINETVDILISEAIQEDARSFNLDIRYGGEIDTSELISLLFAYPVMSERRVVVVRELERLNQKEQLLRYIINPVSTTILVLVARNKPDFRQKFYSELKEYSKTVEFSLLNENEIPRWIQNRISKLGKEITTEACYLLQDYVGKSLSEIHNEIEKLIVFVCEKPIIEVDDVQKVVGISRQFNIFELQKAIVKKDIKKSVFVLGKILQMGENPAKIISYLTTFFLKVLAIKDIQKRRATSSEMDFILGRQILFFNEFKEASLYYTDDDLRVCFRGLLEADEAIKTSSQDSKLILTLLLYNIIRGNVFKNIYNSIEHSTM